MIDRENTCKACDGSGMLSDDEGWQYGCSICRGIGSMTTVGGTAELKETDENNRLLD